MQVDYLVLADAVSVSEGKHYIHGGGWDTLFVASLPATHPMLGVAVRLRIPWDETGQQLALEVDVLGGEGRNSILNEPLRGIVSAERPSNLPPGSDLLLHLALSFTNLYLANSGSYDIVLRVDGEPLAASAASRFNVVAPPAPPE
jgi:hypothetical protein